MLLPLFLACSILVIPSHASNTPLSGNVLQNWMTRGWQTAQSLAYNRWQAATALADQEQAVNDYNTEWIATSPDSKQANAHRRLIVLPLTEAFDPPVGQFSGGHVQTGDKMSLPACFEDRGEMPWLWSVSRIDDGVVTGERFEYPDIDDANDRPPPPPHQPLAALDTVVGGPLDFRAPPSLSCREGIEMRRVGMHSKVSMFFYIEFPQVYIFSICHEQLEDRRTT